MYVVANLNKSCNFYLNARHFTYVLVNRKADTWVGCHFNDTKFDLHAYTAFWYILILSVLISCILGNLWPCSEWKPLCLYYIELNSWVTIPRSFRCGATCFVYFALFIFLYISHIFSYMYIIRFRKDFYHDVWLCCIALYWNPCESYVLIGCGRYYFLCNVSCQMTFSQWAVKSSFIGELSNKDSAPYLIFQLVKIKTIALRRRFAIRTWLLTIETRVDCWCQFYRVIYWYYATTIYSIQ